MATDGASEVDRFESTSGNDSRVSHEAFIDGGGAGEVHKMRHVNGEVFARKLVRPIGKSKAEEVLNEARAIDKLQSSGKCQNLVTVLRHDWLPKSSYYYLDMELCEGNLEDYIEDSHAFTYTRIENPRLLGANFGRHGIWNTWDIMEQITSGLEFIHNCGHVHRDIKSRNVLYSATVNTWKVGDFGLTVEGTSRRAFTTTAARGTQCYRAPELLKEHPKFNNKVDIFAAGCILFELATGGQRAFASDFLVYQYSMFSIPLQIPLRDIDSWSGRKLSDLIPAMLNINSEERPSAKSLRTNFSVYRAITLGEEWKERNDHAKAIEAYLEAANYSPRSFVFENLGHLYTEIGDYASAIPWYNAALRQGAPVIVNLANVFRLDGQYDKAIERYQEAINKDPKNARLWALRGETFLDKAEYDNAIVMFQKASKLAPFESFFRVKLGEIYFTTGNIDASIKAYESAIKRGRTPTLERALAEVKAAKLKTNVSAFSDDKTSVRRLFHRLNIRGLLGNQGTTSGTSIESQTGVQLPSWIKRGDNEAVSPEQYGKFPTRYRRDSIYSNKNVPKIMITPATTDDSVIELKYPDSVENQPPVSNHHDGESSSSYPNYRIGLEDVNFFSVLGRGNSAKIMLAETKKSRQLCAIKVFKKEFLVENDEIETTWTEKRIFLLINGNPHPFLPNLYSCFQTETRVYFVMEYVPGGDLMSNIHRAPFTIPQAQFYGAEVLLALKYLHEHQIIYRDLKLDNILLSSDGHIKLLDFNICKEGIGYGSTTATFRGTPNFMAPEIILEQRYGRAVDWWAFGVLLYQMTLCRSPFSGDDEDEIFNAILSDEPLYPISMPRDPVSIMEQLLTREPEKRLGSGEGDANDIMAHPFFNSINFDDLYHKRIKPPYIPSLQSPTDVSNFDSEFTHEVPILSPVHSGQPLT